jgi:hypothetical protein
MAAGAGAIIALLGIAVEVVAGAASASKDYLEKARGNLKGSIQILNGTQYRLNPVRATFRKGAIFDGTEGEFYTSPKPIDPRRIDVFSYQQILGATTDVVGCVVYRCEVFDLLVGWHLFDRTGIQRYLVSGLFPPFSTDSYFSKTWGADMSQPLNKLIWSGKWADDPGSYASKGASQGMALKVRGSFAKGVASNVTNDIGAPTIQQIEQASDGSSLIFSTSSVGGGSEMQVSVLDAPDLYLGDANDSKRIRSVWMLPGGLKELKTQLQGQGPDSYIRAVLLAGKFCTKQQLTGAAPDYPRKKLIEELAGRTKDTADYYRSLKDADLAGAGAVLVFLRETGSRGDAVIKTYSADTMRNNIIFEMDTFISWDGGVPWLQGRSNMDLVKLVLDPPMSAL